MNQELRKIVYGLGSLLILGFLSGCWTPYYQWREPIHLDHQVLLLPILSKTTPPHPRSSELTQYLHQELQLVSNGKILFAWDISSLQPLLRPENLYDETGLREEEILGITRGLGCGSVFWIELYFYDGLDPQRIVLAATWKRNDGTLYNRHVLDINMRDPETQEEFRSFIEYTTQMGKMIQGWWSNPQWFETHTAKLSPEIFLRFTAAKTVQMTMSPHSILYQQEKLQKKLQEDLRHQEIEIVKRKATQEQLSSQRNQENQAIPAPKQSIESPTRSEITNQKEGKTLSISTISEPQASSASSTHNEVPQKSITNFDLMEQEIEELRKRRIALFSAYQARRERLGLTQLRAADQTLSHYEMLGIQGLQGIPPPTSDIFLKWFTNEYEAIGKRLANYAKIYYAEGVRLLHQSQWSRATNYLQTALELDPYYPEALYYRGILAFLEDKWKQASLDFERIILLKHRSLAPYAALFLFLIQMEEFQKSLQLEQYLAKFGLSGWPLPIFELYLGKKSFDEIWQGLPVRTKVGQEYRAILSYFYGELLLLHADTFSLAERMFQQAKTYASEWQDYWIIDYRLQQIEREKN